ncbi:hypothetical protein GALMADRAFT_252755 [Galerina marginata CBS 339.88]|uniref:Mitochondrial carrier n=1 Tax=Galerina marginata (strain CBS 339.88) TaxID=685588 RepID=A0A067SNT9_GALM3|nr:hypothetical protein GALMADRAFT_252755 [Galerina marginata CBS 339.88]
MASTLTQAGEIASSSRDHVGCITPDEESILTPRRAMKDILFGSVAGMVAEVFEYPFDLAKVRLQAQLLAPSSSHTKHFNGPMDCLMQTWKDEGVRGLYRGLPAPIVGSMAETAALFLAYTTFQNVIRSYSSSPTSLYTHSPPLSIPQLGLAAGGAGFVTSFVLTPIELIKCKMQVQMMNFHPSQIPSASPGRIPRRIPNAPSLSPYYFTSKGTQTLKSSIQTLTTGRMLTTAVETFRPPGPIALIRSIVDTYGVRGLWLGHTGTLLRETGGTASWFVAKEWVARELVKRRIRQSPYISTGNGSPIPRTVANTELLSWESAVSGAIAGAVGALLFYPADTVKSAIQTEDELLPRGTSTGKRGTFTKTFREMWAKHGIRGLYAGCGMTVARAVPSSGIIFVVYDGLNAYFL